MKVILLQDVKKLGKKGDTVKVADGYGQNFLIKNKLAVLETDTSRKIVEVEKETQHQQDLENQAKARELAKQIEGIRIYFKIWKRWKNFWKCINETDRRTIKR